MNSLQINHLAQLLRQRKSLTNIKYQFYRCPVPLKNWWLYAPISKAGLTDAGNQEILFQNIKAFYRKRDEAINLGHLKVPDPYVREFSFQQIKPSYARWAWFGGIIANYRMQSQNVQIMLQDVYTLTTYLRPRKIEEHLWLNINQMQTTKPDLQLGLGDFLILLAKPVHYHHLNWIRRNKFTNPRYRHGIVKYGLASPILVGTYYPETSAGRLDYLQSYAHHDHFLVRIQKPLGTPLLSFGTDLMSKDKLAIKNGLVKFQPHNRKDLQRQLKSTINGFVTNVLNGQLQKGQMLVLKRNGNDLSFTTLNQIDSRMLDKMIVAHGTLDKFYSIAEQSYLPLIREDVVRRKFYSYSKNQIRDVRNNLLVRKWIKKKIEDRLKNLKVHLNADLKF